MDDIFLSYATANRKFVEKIRNDLEKKGKYSVWMDHCKIKGGHTWELELDSNIRNCKVFVVTVTNASNESKWVRREFIRAEGLQKPIIPLLRDGVLPLRLLDIQYIDFQDDNQYDTGIQELLEVMRGFLPSTNNGHNVSGRAIDSESNTGGSNCSSSSSEIIPGEPSALSVVTRTISSFYSSLWQTKKKHAKAGKVFMPKSSKHSLRFTSKSNHYQSRNIMQRATSHSIPPTVATKIPTKGINERREAIQKLLFCVPHGWAEGKLPSFEHVESAKNFLCQARLQVSNTFPGHEKDGVNTFLENVLNHLYVSGRPCLAKIIEKDSGIIILKLKLANQDIGPLDFTPDGQMLKLLLQGIDNLNKSLIEGCYKKEVFVSGSWTGSVCILLRAQEKMISSLTDTFEESSKGIDLGNGIIIANICSLFHASLQPSAWAGRKDGIDSDYPPENKTLEDAHPYIRLAKSLDEVLTDSQTHRPRVCFQIGDGFSDFTAYKKDEEDEFTLLIPSSNQCLEQFLEYGSQYWNEMEQVLSCETANNPTLIDLFAGLQRASTDLERKEPRADYNLLQAPVYKSRLAGDNSETGAFPGLPPHEDITHERRQQTSAREVSENNLKQTPKDVKEFDTEDIPFDRPVRKNVGGKGHMMLLEIDSKQEQERNEAEASAEAATSDVQIYARADGKKVRRVKRAASAGAGASSLQGFLGGPRSHPPSQQISPGGAQGGGPRSGPRRGSSLFSGPGASGSLHLHEQEQEEFNPYPIRVGGGPSTRRDSVLLQAGPGGGIGFGIDLDDSDYEDSDDEPTPHGGPHGGGLPGQPMPGSGGGGGNPPGTQVSGGPNHRPLVGGFAAAAYEAARAHHYQGQQMQKQMQQRGNPSQQGRPGSRVGRRGLLQLASKDAELKAKDTGLRATQRSQHSHHIETSSISSSEASDDRAKFNKSRILQRDEVRLGGIVSTGSFNSVYNIKTIGLHEQSSPWPIEKTQQRQHIVETAKHTTLLLKCIDPNLDPRKRSLASRRLLHEAKLLITKLFDHPNIIKVVGTASEDVIDTNFFFIAPMSDYTLYDAINGRKWNKFQSGKPEFLFSTQVNAAIDIASGLDHLHSLNIMWSDLKPENIGYTMPTDCWKLCNLSKAQSLARKARGNSFKEDQGRPTKPYNMDLRTSSFYHGTPPYAAPELSTKIPCNIAVDTFSFAIVLWEIASVTFCFGRDDEATHGTVWQRPGFDNDVPIAVKGIIQQCWGDDPRYRPYMKDVVSKLKNIHRTQSPTVVEQSPTVGPMSTSLSTADSVLALSMEKRMTAAPTTKQRTESNRNADDKIPDLFICPISQELMHDPVILIPVGRIFDRQYLCRWLKDNPCKDPLSGILYDEPLSYVDAIDIRNLMMEQYGNDQYQRYDDSAHLNLQV